MRAHWAQVVTGACQPWPRGQHTRLTTHLAPKLLNATSTGRPELGPCSCSRFIHETAERGQQVTVGAVTAGYVACDPRPAGQQRKHRVPCGGTISQRELSRGVLFKPLNFQESTFLLVDFFFFLSLTHQQIKLEHDQSQNNAMPLSIQAFH